MIVFALLEDSESSQVNMRSSDTYMARLTRLISTFRV